jgi:hypothetical protein
MSSIAQSRIRGAFILDASAQMAAIARQIAMFEDIRKGYVEQSKSAELIAAADSQIAHLRTQASQLTQQVNQQGAVQ